MRRVVMACLAGTAAAFCGRTSQPRPVQLVAHETTGPADTKISSPAAKEVARIQGQVALAERLAITHASSELHGTLAVVGHGKLTRRWTEQYEPAG
jgi:hypothetical protein